MTVRPWILIRLLDYLIDHNHEVFRGKWSAQELRRKMREAVHEKYPTAAHDVGKPEEEQVGFVPNSIIDLLGEDTEESCSKRLRLFRDKNATLGDGARTLENCLDDVRPDAMCLGKSAEAASDPATLREGAIERYGELNVRTDATAILQFHSVFFTSAPFCDSLHGIRARFLSRETLAKA